MKQANTINSWHTFGTVFVTVGLLLVIGGVSGDIFTMVIIGGFIFVIGMISRIHGYRKRGKKPP